MLRLKNLTCRLLIKTLARFLVLPSPFPLVPQLILHLLPSPPSCFLHLKNPPSKFSFKTGVTKLCRSFSAAVKKVLGLA